jgi:hypothetical protein
MNMTKLRKSLSIEDGVMSALGLLGADHAALLVEEHPRQVRFWSDPDSPRSGIPMQKALVLDRACLALGQPAPLLRAYRAGLRGAAPAGPGAAADPKALLCDVVAEVGDLAAEVRDGANPGSPGGGAYTLDEGRDILIEIGQAEAALEALRQRVLARLPALAEG